MGDLLDVVYQREQLPLCIDFGFAAQGEAPQPLVLEVGEHRFDNGDTLIIDIAPKQRVELAFHPFDGFVFAFLCSTQKDRHLFGFGLVGIFKTAMAQVARAAG